MYEKFVSKAGGATALTRVAILGSCVSRDAFGVDPTAHSIDLVTCVSRTSIASMLAPGSDPDRVNFGTASNFELRSAHTELRKTAVAEIAAALPNWIIVDLIDDRFDLLLSRDGALVAGSPVIMDRSDLRKSDGLDFVRAPRAWESVQRLCLLRAREWIDSLRAIVPEHRIIIHRALWAADAGPDEKETASNAIGRLRYIEIQNRRLAALYDRLQALAPAARAIVVPNALRVADPGHQWGPAPYHYIRAYYVDFMAQLHAILAEAEQTACPVIPSAVQPAQITVRNGVAATDHDEPAAFVERLVEKAFAGDPDLALRLGRSLLQDGLVEADPGLAFVLLGFAALIGNGDAVLETGLCLLDGNGIPPNPALGLAWIRQAERRGVRKAQRVVGELHLEGQHLPKRQDLARIYLRRAAEAGDGQAARRLAHLFEAGIGGDMDSERARYWRRQAERTIRRIVGDFEITSLAASA